MLGSSMRRRLGPGAECGVGCRTAQCRRNSSRAERGVCHGIQRILSEFTPSALFLSQLTISSLPSPCNNWPMTTPPLASETIYRCKYREVSTLISFGGAVWAFRLTSGAGADRLAYTLTK